MTSPTVYLDHAATTPMLPSAVEAMAPFLEEAEALEGRLKGLKGEPARSRAKEPV